MWQIQVLLLGTFWNFFPNIFHLLLVEFGCRTTDTEGPLYTSCLHDVCINLIDFTQQQKVPQGSKEGS